MISLNHHGLGLPETHLAGESVEVRIEGRAGSDGGHEIRLVDSAVIRDAEIAHPIPLTGR